MRQYLSPVCRVLIFTLIITGIFSCNSSEPISTNEALAFARHIEEAFTQRDENTLNNMLDMDELAGRIADKESSGFNPSLKQNVREGIKKMNFGTQMLAEKNATYQLVKHYIKKRKHHLIFRYYSDKGLNYHDFELVKHKGKIAAADVYLYLVGLHVSEMIARTARLLEDDKLSDYKANQIPRLQQQIASGEYETAAQTFRQLPMSIQQSKIGRLYQIKIALGLGDTAAYNRHIATYIQKYPDNADIYMLQLGASVNSKDYRGFLDAVNNLDAYIDKDPFLDYYRGLAYKMMKKTDSAGMYFTKLHEAMPDMGEALLEMIITDLKLGKTKDAKEHIAAYKANRKYNQKMMPAMAIAHPEYAAYFR